MADNGKTRQAIAKVQAVVGAYVAPDYETDQDVEIYVLGDGTNDFGHTGGADSANGLMTKGTSYSQMKTHSRTFQVDMKPSSSLIIAPKWWKFLEGCGFKVDLTPPNATATWSGRPTCTPLDIDFPQWSCDGDGGTAFAMSSATGSFDLAWDNAGGVLMPSFTFMGKYAGFKDVLEALFFLPSGHDTTACSTFLGGTVVFGGYTHNVWSGSIAQGADNQAVGKSDDLTNGIRTGISYVGVKGADVQCTLNVERIKKATYDYESDIVNNTVLASVVLAFDGFEIALGVAQSTDWQASTANESGAFDITMKIDTIQLKLV